MSNRTLHIEHEGQTFHGRVATIDSTTLGPEGHGLWTTMLHCHGDGWGVSVGGYRADGAYGIEFVKAFVHTAGVESWEDLRGARIVVLFERSGFGGRAVGIAHISDESKVFILQELADALREREQQDQPPF